MNMFLRVLTCDLWLMSPHCEPFALGVKCCLYVRQALSAEHCLCVRQYTWEHVECALVLEQAVFHMLHSTTGAQSFSGA